MDVASGFALFSHKLLLLFVCAAILIGVGDYASAQNTSSNCPTSYTINKANKLFSKCSTLPVQSATLAWTYDTQNYTLEVLFSGVAPATAGWVGWGINLNGIRMIGTQAFIAFAASNGSTILTYDVTAATKGGTPLKCTPISLHVLDMEVEISGTSILMLVSLQLQANQSTLHHVWNRGATVSNFQPGAHGVASSDLSSMTTIDMASGAASSSSIQLPRQILKNRHGVVNTVGWGILLPCGVIAARYLRPFSDPAWFYIHVFLQLAGYALGVAGWATGLRLGSYSVGVVYHKHRNVGIALFAVATLQVTALLLRPKKDHKIRKAWNIYHYTLGTTILVLGILNIFYGFDILSPPGKWRRAYIGVLIALAALTVCLELLSWIHTYMRKSSQNKIQGAHVSGAHGLGNAYRQDA
eukprot:c21323_g1_i1 orf=222-1457(-)